ncbi:28S ribosomal protein S22-like protein [Leptotrombidium deliense]|uniref:28S ribosomal protein S22-like protein n=1 Tax=Leptotrombidium deliense TaxID=299467 RepID=A0A443SKZ6_9ACAR|nr:28S ribosomal protein S22-like protein [Leptotrombidium deliense]
MFHRKFVNNFFNSSKLTGHFLKYFSSEQRDIEKLFVRKDVQQLLKDVTHCNLEKIFSPRPVNELRSPRYLFMTNEDLKMTYKRAERIAEERLSMPPVMNPREDSSDVLDIDPAIQGSGQDTGKYVFTDISLGFNDRNRLIVVREPNGVLRRANRQERYRMNQIFYPRQGRTIELPKMFEDENFEEVLDRHEYLFVLERICLQLEPDDPLYIKLTHKTYDHIDTNAKYDLLRSTRQFGPMVFHFAYNNKIDGLLIDAIDRHLISDACKIIKLYYTIQNREASLIEETDELKVIKSYIVNDSKRRHYLEVSMKNYENSLTEQQQLNDKVEVQTAA